MSNKKEYSSELKEIFDDLKSSVDKLFEDYKNKLEKLDKVDKDIK